MQMVSLTATARTSTKPRQLRRDGSVPGVVYGNTEHTQIQCDEKTLRKAYATAGESTLVELAIDSKKVPVLFHALQYDPISDRPIHVDFLAVDLKKEIETQVPLRLTGESPAAKDLAAIIVTAQAHITVRALPMNLPHDITVDISSLVAFRDTITVAKLSIPQGVTIVDPPETVLVVAQQPREEEKEEPKPAAEGEAVAGAEGAVAGAADGTAPAAEGEAKEKEAKDKK